MLINALDQSIFSKHVITMHEGDSGFRSHLNDDVSYFCLDYRRRNAPASLFRLFRYLRSEKIDVLHCHMYHAAVKGAMVGRLAGVSSILVSEHGKNTWKNSWSRFIERHVVSRWTVLRVAVSEDIRRIRIEQDGVPENTIELMQNAVNTSVTPVDAEKIPKRLGSLGRFVDAKDFPMLFRAIRQLRDRGYEVELEIAGDGVERKNMEHSLDELGLGGVVHLPGIRNAHEFLSSIDLFVMSSKREGVPVSMLEAMAHGLPIAATAVGGIPEVIEHGRDGLLSSAGDPDGLADNIAMLIEDENLRVMLGSNARAKAVERYGIDSIARRWEGLYMRVLSISDPGAKAV